MLTYFFASVLHRFIRLKVKCPLFSGHRVVSIQMLSPLEATNLSAVGMDVMERGRERLVLRPFVFNVANDLNQSWRSSPSNMIIKNRFISNSNAILNPLCESDLISFAETTTDFPVEFDGLITIPNERGENYCYQLTCVSQERNQGEQIQRSGLLFARELPSFLDFTSSKIVDCSDPMVLTANFHSCSTLPMLLPWETIFSQSLLTLAHTAMERSNAIVFGEQGSGKTCTALTLAATARLTHRCSTVYMDCTKLRDSRLIRMKDILSELTQLFDDAAASVPCVVVLDDLDVLTPTCDDRASVDASVQQHQMNPIEIDQSKLVTDVIVKLLRSLQQGISIIITCKFPEALPTCLPSMRLLSYKVAVPSFEEIDRERLYQSFLQRHCPTHVMASLHRIDFKRKTTGFRPRDLEQLAKRALQNWRLRSNSQFDVNEVTLGELVAFLPLSRLHTSPESSNNVAELSWSAIGGLSRAKTELTKTVVQPSRYRRIYEKSRIRLPRGILLYGFPGTGKTVCVPALAKECGFPLIMCRGPELLDKYIGASEAKVRDLFARAAASAPSILFIDELDSLAPRRGSDSTGVTDRIVNQLLTFLDGVEDNTAGGQVYVVATTSRPDKIDPALLRPGRFEKHVFFGYAEDNGEITDILTKISARYNLDTEASRAISSGDFVKSFQDESVKLGRLSPADFKSVFSSGQLMAAHEALSFGQTETNALIRLSHIFESFTSARPSLVQSDFEHLNDIYSSFGGRARASAGKGLKTEALRTALK